MIDDDSLPVFVRTPKGDMPLYLEDIYLYCPFIPLSISTFYEADSLEEKLETPRSLTE